jgi:hypothetical protein
MNTTPFNSAGRQVKDQKRNRIKPVELEDHKTARKRKQRNKQCAAVANGISRSTCAAVHGLRFLAHAKWTLNL